MILMLSLLYAGCTALSLAMPRHFRQVFPGRPIPSTVRPALRGLGWLLVIGGVMRAIQQFGVANGLVWVLGGLTALVLVQVLLLTYRPRWIVVPLLLLPCLGLVAGLVL